MNKLNLKQCARCGTDIPSGLESVTGTMLIRRFSLTKGTLEAIPTFCKECLTGLLAYLKPTFEKEEPVSETATDADGRTPMGN